MKWLRWWRRGREVPPSEGIQRAQERLDQVTSKDDEVNRLAARLRAIRDHDDFAALLSATFRPRQ